MNANKLPKWKKFLKWVHESDPFTIKDAIDAGVAKDAKDFHNLLYILKQKDLVDVAQNNGVYVIYTDEDEVEETLGGFYEWDDKNGLQFIFNDEDKKEDPLSSKLDKLSDELEKKCDEIDELKANLNVFQQRYKYAEESNNSLREKLQRAENNIEKLRVKLQIANHANNYLQENIDKLRTEVESLKKRNTYENEIDANIKCAYKNLAKTFAILGDII